MALKSGALQARNGHFARTLVALKFKADLLAFFQTAKAGTLNSRDVNEGVCAAVIGLNKAVAFGGIEPFYGARGHEKPFPAHSDRPAADAGGSALTML